MFILILVIIILDREWICRNGIVWIYWVSVDGGYISVDV